MGVRLGRARGGGTSRYFGETATQLLRQVEWYADNSQQLAMLPVGSLKPTILGCSTCWAMRMKTHDSMGLMPS